MLHEPLRKYFKIALEENLDFYKVDLGFEDVSDKSYTVRDWDSRGLKLDNLDGTEAGEIDESSMQYWSVVRVHRKIPLGSRNNFTVLELI